MSKFRSLILIIGLLLIAVAAALLTVLVLYATGVIVTDPIELVITIEDNSKEYDGTPLKAEKYTLTEGELLQGHTLQVEFTGSQTNAGESESDLVAKVLDEKGFDVTKEYAFKTKKGTLTVNPLEISVEIHGEEVPYNGKQIDLNEYVFTQGKLLRGHKLVAVSDEELLTAGKQLTKDNLQVLVYDPLDNPVTENYVLNYEMEGTIKIIKRPITIKPVGATKIYDGLKLECNSYEITSELQLAPNQTVTVSYYGDGDDKRAWLTDAGTKRIYIDRQNFKICDENSEPVTDNYEVAFVSDVLTIERRGLTLTAKSGSWVYDGNAHSYENESGVYLVEGLASGEKISAVTYSGSITDVGTKPNEITHVEFEKGVNANNYAYVMIAGTLEVTPMSITVYSKYIYKEYDGQSLGDYVKELKTTLYDTAPVLPEGFKLESENEIEDLVDAGSGVYTLKKVKVKNSEDKDSSGNFLISVISGQYTIDKKDLQFKLNDLTKTYKADKQEISVEEAFNGVTLPQGITSADFELVCAQDGYKNAGTYSYSAKLKDAKKANNYELKVTDGSLTVTKYNVRIVLDDLGSKPYDGTLAKLEKDSISFEAEDNVLEKAYPEIATYTYEVTPTDDYMAQTVKVMSVSITAGGEDITGNLNIDYSVAEGEVELEYASRAFQVSVLDAVATNFGMLYAEISKYVIATSLVAGDKLVIPEDAVYPSGSGNKGKIWVDVTQIRIENSAGVDVTDLYVHTGDTTVSGNYILTSAI